MSWRPTPSQVNPCGATDALLTISWYLVEVARPPSPSHLLNSFGKSLAPRRAHHITAASSISAVSCCLASQAAGSCASAASPFSGELLSRGTPSPYTWMNLHYFFFFLSGEDSMVGSSVNENRAGGRRGHRAVTVVDYLWSTIGTNMKGHPATAKNVATLGTRRHLFNRRKCILSAA